MLRDFSSGNAGESAAVLHVTPTEDVPRSQKFEGHRVGVTQARHAFEAGQAVSGTSPAPALPDPHTLSGGDVGMAEASTPTSPRGVLPQPSNTRRARKSDDVSDAGQTICETQLVTASIASNSLSRRKTGAGSATERLKSTNPMSNPQNSEIGGDTEESRARKRAKPNAALPDSQPVTRRKAGKARQATSAAVTIGTLPAAHNSNSGSDIETRGGKQDASPAPNHSVSDDGCRVDLRKRDIQAEPVDPALITEIAMQWRMRQLWLRAGVGLTLQAKSFCRRLAVEGDKKEADVIYKAALGKGEHPMASLAMAAMLPLLDARDGIEAKGGEIEKALVKLAKQLPVAPFVVATRGASLKGLAAIVGEAGDLSKYGNPGKLWKRMGLAPHQGKAYATWRSDGGLTAADWTEAGYSPKRRSAMFVIGGSLIGGMGKGKRPLVNEDISAAEWSPLEKLFVERLRHEAARDPENMARPPTAEGKESFSRWAAARSQRYVEKRFLRLLWQAWRGGPASAVVMPIQDASILPQTMEPTL